MYCLYTIQTQLNLLNKPQNYKPLFMEIKILLKKLYFPDMKIKQHLLLLNLDYKKYLITLTGN